MHWFNSYSKSTILLLVPCFENWTYFVPSNRKLACLFQIIKSNMTSKRQHLQPLSSWSPAIFPFWGHDWYLVINIFAIERKSPTSRYHGSNISGSQQTEIKTSLKKWIRTNSNFIIIHLIQIHLICQMLAKLLGLNPKGPYLSLEKEEENFCFHPLHIKCRSRATTECTKKAWCTCKVIVLLM